MMKTTTLQFNVGFQPKKLDLRQGFITGFHPYYNEEEGSDDERKKNRKSKKVNMKFTVTEKSIYPVQAG